MGERVGRVSSHVVSRWSTSPGCCHSGFRECVLGAAGFRVIFSRFIFLERPQPAASMRPPPGCRLQGFLPHCFEPIPGTLCCATVCCTRGPPEMFVQLHGMAALLLCSSYMLLLLTPAGVTIHATHMPPPRLRGTRLARPPNPSTTHASPLHSPNPCQLEQSVTGTRVQSIPSARYAKACAI